MSVSISDPPQLSTDRPFDLIGIGEILAEFSRVDERLWRQSWAGDVGNTLFHAGRLGLRTGLVTTVGNDPFTEMIVTGLEGAAIDLSLVATDPHRPNGLYFIELDERGEHTFHFRRSDSAARRTLERLDHDTLVDYCARSSWLLISGVTLGVMGATAKLSGALSALRNHTTRIAFDTNHRPALWPSPASYRAAVESILPFIDLFLPSRDDLERAWPERSAEETVRSFATHGLSRTAMKCGADGCLLLWDDQREEIPADRDVVVVDTSGAGDAFNAGFLAELMRSGDPIDAARRGCEIAAGVVGVRGARGGDRKPDCPERTTDR